VRPNPNSQNEPQGNPRQPSGGYTSLNNTIR